MTSEFAPGVSDPADFTVDDVVEALATADPTERERVLGLEADGKARKGILESEPPPGPTDTTGLEPEPVEDPDAVKVGDYLDDSEDGYARQVISTDGLPTEATREAETQETPDLV